MASGVVSKVDSRHSWSGGKWQKRREKKRGGGGSSLDSSEFGFWITWRDGEGSAVCQRGVLWSRAGGVSDKVAFV